jgi:hypothetical protein
MRQERREAFREISRSKQWSVSLLQCCSFFSRKRKAMGAHRFCGSEEGRISILASGQGLLFFLFVNFVFFFFEKLNVQVLLGMLLLRLR